MAEFRFFLLVRLAIVEFRTDFVGDDGCLCGGSADDHVGQLLGILGAILPQFLRLLVVAAHELQRDLLFGEGQDLC